MFGSILSGVMKGDVSLLVEESGQEKETSTKVLRSTIKALLRRRVKVCNRGRVPRGSERVSFYEIVVILAHYWRSFTIRVR